MAAIIHLEPTTSRPVLRLVPPARPTRADYARRRIAVLLVVLLVAVLAVRLPPPPAPPPPAPRGAGAAPAGAAAVSPGAAGAPAVTIHSPLAYGASGTPVPDRSVYVVQPGDTLWSIAAQLAPGQDVRAMVDHLVSLNGGAALEVGQRLRLS